MIINHCFIIRSWNNALCVLLYPHEQYMLFSQNVCYKTGVHNVFVEWILHLIFLWGVPMYSATTRHNDESKINTLRPRQNGRHFQDDIFKSIFWNENVWISIKTSLKFVPKCPINNIPTLVQIMAWRRHAPSHYLNQWWLDYRRIYASLGLIGLDKFSFEVLWLFQIVNRISVNRRHFLNKRDPMEYQCLMS